MGHEGFLSVDGLRFEQRAWRAGGWGPRSWIRLGEVFEERLPGIGHRYFLVGVGRAIVDVIYVANLPCFDG
ncbi:hypothetical protein EFJ98_11025 [Pseudomonas putida]|nr:hypothetical protein EFJ98_11025 [Pseudomonas putida]